MKPLNFTRYIYSTKRDAASMKSDFWNIFWLNLRTETTGKYPTAIINYTSSILRRGMQSQNSSSLLLSFFVPFSAWKPPLKHLTENFSILEPQNPPIHELAVVQKRESKDCEALKLHNNRSGIVYSFYILIVEVFFVDKILFFLVHPFGRLAFFQSKLASSFLVCPSDGRFSFHGSINH